MNFESLCSSFPAVGRCQILVRSTNRVSQSDTDSGHQALSLAVRSMIDDSHATHLRVSHDCVAYRNVSNNKTERCGNVAKRQHRQHQPRGHCFMSQSTSPAGFILVAAAIALCRHLFAPSRQCAEALATASKYSRSWTTASTVMSLRGGQNSAFAARHQGSSPGDDFKTRRDPVSMSLTRPVLAQITADGPRSIDATAQLLRSVEKAVAGGVSLVQLRDYKSDKESKAELARRLRRLTVGSNASFVVNVNDGDLERARTFESDGVHLPERSISLLADLRRHSSGARPAWPVVVGCSVHSVNAALEAAKLGTDYVQVGTMFATMSHPGKEPEGVELLRGVRHKLDAEGFEGVFVIGVGGIDADNCGSVMTARADGVAAIRCLLGGDDAEKEAERMLKSMGESMLDAQKMPATSSQ